MQNQIWSPLKATGSGLSEQRNILTWSYLDRPELLILTKIQIKHGKDHPQCRIKTALACSTKETPHIYIYAVSKAVFICLSHNASEKVRREPSICSLPSTGNVCTTVNQLRRRGWQEDNPASSAVSQQRQPQGTSGLGAGPAPAHCGIPLLQREH